MHRGARGCLGPGRFKWLGGWHRWKEDDPVRHQADRHGQAIRFDQIFQHDATFGRQRCGSVTPLNNVRQPTRRSWAGGGEDRQAGAWGSGARWQPGGGWHTRLVGYVENWNDLRWKVRHDLHQQTFADRRQHGSHHQQAGSSRGKQAQNETAEKSHAGSGLAFSCSSLAGSCTLKVVP